MLITHQRLVDNKWYAHRKTEKGKVQFYAKASKVEKSHHLNGIGVVIEDEEDEEKAKGKNAVFIFYCDGMNHLDMDDSTFRSIPFRKNMSMGELVLLTKLKGF